MAHEISSGTYGPRMELQGPWTSSEERVFRKKGIKELEINYAKGFKGNSVEFLRELDGLDSLEITDWTIDDIDAVNDLNHLRRLSIQTYCDTCFRFDRFSRLEDCFLEWRKGGSSVFSCTTLQSLKINRFKRKHTNDFKTLINLRSLGLYNTPVNDLEGLGGLINLTFLGLYNLRTLEHLEPLGHLTNLRTLEVQGCRKISDIGALRRLTKLVRLSLSENGRIATFSPIQCLTYLRELLFYGSTVVEDGDLGFIEELAHLENLAFKNRPHYSHRSDDFRVCGND